MSIFGLGAIAQQVMGVAAAPGAGIQYVGGKQINFNTAGSTFDFAGLTGGIASEADIGDLYIFFASAANLAGYVITAEPVGYIGTIVNQTRSDVIGCSAIAAYGFFEAGTDDFTIETNTGAANGGVVVYRGVNLTTPLDVATPAIWDSGDSNSPNPPAITPVTDGAMIVPLGFTSDNNATGDAPFTGAGNFTTRIATSGNDFQSASGEKLWTTADGTFDPDPWLGGGGFSLSAAIAATIALRPA